MKIKGVNHFQEIESYNTPDCGTMIKPKGGLIRASVETGGENRVFISAFISHLVTFYTKAWEALSLLYSRKKPNRLNYEYRIVSRFVRCNFSEYDANNLGIDAWGRFYLEKVRYLIRDECPLVGIVCKPEPNTTLSFWEANAFYLVIERYKVDDTVQLFHISPYTVANHIWNIYEETSTRTIAGLVSYRHTHNSE